MTGQHVTDISVISTGVIIYSLNRKNKMEEYTFKAEMINNINKRPIPEFENTLRAFFTYYR